MITCIHMCILLVAVLYFMLPIAADYIWPYCVAILHITYVFMFARHFIISLVYKRTKKVEGKHEDVYCAH